MPPRFFHGIEHLTVDDEGFVSWKGKRVERFDPDFAQTDAAIGRARMLAARCKHLEERGKPVNKMNVVLRWGERVMQEPAGAGRGRS
jgi:hypothetical protein